MSKPTTPSRPASQALPTLPRGDSLLALELALLARAVAHGQINPQHALLERKFIDKASQVLSRGELRSAAMVKRAFTELTAIENRPRWFLHRGLRAAAARIPAPGMALAQGVVWAMPFEARFGQAGQQGTADPAPPFLSGHECAAVGQLLVSAGLVDPTAQPFVSPRVLWAHQSSCPSLAQVAAAGQALWASKGKGRPEPQGKAAPTAPSASQEAASPATGALHGWIWGVAACGDLEFARWAAMETTAGQLAALRADERPSALLSWASLPATELADKITHEADALNESLGRAVFSGRARVEVLDLPRAWSDAMEAGVQAFRRAALQTAVQQLARQAPDQSSTPSDFQADLDIPPPELEGFAVRIARRDGPAALVLWPLQGDEAPDQALAELRAGLAHSGISAVGLLAPATRA